MVNQLRLAPCLMVEFASNTISRTLMSLELNSLLKGHRDAVYSVAFLMCSNNL